MALIDLPHTLSALMEASKGLPHVQRSLFFLIAGHWSPESKRSGAEHELVLPDIKMELSYFDASGDLVLPDTEEIEAALDELQKRGLIERLEGHESLGYIFRVPLLEKLAPISGGR